MPKDPIETNWAEVAAKAQAYQALTLARLDDASIVDKARFLMILGLSRAEAAGLIGSTDESLRKGFERADKRRSGNPKAPAKAARGD